MTEKLFDALLNDYREIEALRRTTLYQLYGKLLDCRDMPLKDAIRFGIVRFNFPIEQRIKAEFVK